MLTNIPRDFALEQTAVKNAAAKKAAAAAQVAIAVEKYRTDTADALAKAVEREVRIEMIPILAARVTALENQQHAEHDKLRWLRRHWIMVASIIVANAAVSALLFRLLR